MNNTRSKSDKNLSSLFHQHRKILHDSSSDPAKYFTTKLHESWYSITYFLQNIGKSFIDFVHATSRISGKNACNAIHYGRNAWQKFTYDSALQAGNRSVHILQTVLISSGRLYCFVGHNATELMNAITHGLCFLCGRVKQWAELLGGSSQKLLRKRCSFGSFFHSLQASYDSREQIFLAHAGNCFLTYSERIKGIGTFDGPFCQCHHSTLHTINARPAMLQYGIPFLIRIRAYTHFLGIFVYMISV